MAIDRRKKYYCVIDTETAPMDKDFNGVSPYNMLVYDVGYAIVDKKGNVYRTRSFVNANIFLDEKELMKSAYYANKIPKYWEDIKSKKRILTSFYNIKKTLCEDCKEFGIKEIYAHNARFDYGSLNNSSRWLTKSKYRYFFPYGITICDTLKMARQVIAPMPTYRIFCEREGYLTKNNQVRLTAEIIYKYISGNYDFEEVHCGLDDVMIEKDILKYCFAKKKKMERRLWAD